jgi:hypothetical protein
MKISETRSSKIYYILFLQIKEKHLHTYAYTWRANNGPYSVLISDERPFNQIDVFRGFPRPLKTNSGTGFKTGQTVSLFRLLFTFSFSEGRSVIQTELYPTNNSGMIIQIKVQL